MTRAQLAHTTLRPCVHRGVYRGCCPIGRVDIALHTLKVRGLVDRIGWRAGAGIYSHV
jgi:hypothetical protein